VDLLELGWILKGSSQFIPFHFAGPMLASVWTPLDLPQPVMGEISWQGVATMSV
jgi:hypothetical protein